MENRSAAIIGITGRMGTRIAKELLERGIEVTGINRRPERVPARCDFTCRTVKADAGDFDGISAAIAGSDTVVMVTEPIREAPEQYTRDVMNVVSACKAQGVKHFVILVNFYALKAPDGRPMMEAYPEHPLFQPIENAYSDASELLRQETELDWVIFAAPAEMAPYAGKTEVFRTGFDTLITTDDTNPAIKETSRISMEDMAGLIADQVETNRWSHRMVTAAY